MQTYPDIQVCGSCKNIRLCSHSDHANISRYSGIVIMQTYLDIQVCGLCKHIRIFRHSDHANIYDIQVMWSSKDVWIFRHCDHANISGCAGIVIMQINPYIQVQWSCKPILIFRYADHANISGYSGIVIMQTYPDVQAQWSCKLIHIFRYSILYWQKYKDLFVREEVSIVSGCSCDSVMLWNIYYLILNFVSDIPCSCGKLHQPLW
jgi:hypothetical protein